MEIRYWVVARDVKVEGDGQEFEVLAAALLLNANCVYTALLFRMELRREASPMLPSCFIHINGTAQ